MKNLLTGLVFLGLATAPFAAMAQSNTDQSKFKQLQQELPTPNTYRSASGAPGHQYWQQRADYNIKVELNDENQSITGSETITYTNNSPDVLTYLWLQLDQNIFEPNSMANSTRTGTLNGRMPVQAVEYMAREDFDGGFKIKSVKDKNGKALKFTINNTMMRVDLPGNLNPKQSFTFTIDWNHNINDQLVLDGRSGYEYFPGDGNYLYEMAQWFPRMAVYDDVNGWQHKQFLGSGEFALPFGDYKVSITVPADHIVGATGELQNASQVLTATQQKRWAQAAKSDKPIVIVTQEEATKAEKSKAKGKKTWVYA
ncbi:MAG TPA: M1 family peptidase, partial [Pontibacter sp.]